MITFKEKISSISDYETLKKCVYQNTGVFYKLYNNAELMADKSYKKELISKNDLINVFMYDCIVEDVKTKLKQKETQTNKKISEYELIKKLLAGNEISKRKRYKLQNKKSILERTINNDCCFGGKALLRNITKHAQEAQNIGGKFTDEEVKNKTQLYERELSEFRSKRTLGVYIIGACNMMGNRNFIFDLSNNKIIFKINRHNHVVISFKSRRDKIYLEKLQYLIDTKQIPITVRITETHVCFSFDESIVSGFNFEETEYCRTIKANEIKTKEGKKEIAKQFYERLKVKMLIGKMLGRYAAVDLNPKEISLVIGDKLNVNGESNIIYKQVFNLEKLCDKTGFASDSKKEKSYNNKRKHEIKEIWKRIFTICIHYKVFNFVSEELNFKDSRKKETTNVEFNRQTKNIWHLKLTKNLISKYIKTFGFKHVEVNPAYSSFIGNMVNTDYDPIAAALELLRRGMVRFEKGNSLYPSLHQINRQKLVYLACENGSWKTWQQLYKHVTRAGMRYRNRDENLRAGINKNFNSRKSRVKILCL